MASKIDEFHNAIAERPAFPENEYRRRIETARMAMEEIGIELLILFDPQSVCYFSGYSTVNLWDFAAFVLPRDREPSVVIWDFELGRLDASGCGASAVTYRAGASPVDALIDSTGRHYRTWASDDWAVSMAPAAWRAVANALRCEHRDARPVLWATRLRKSPAELDVLRQSARITDVGVAAAVDAATAGARDFDIAAAAAEAMLSAGSEHFAIQPIVAVGPRAGVPHSEACGRTVSEGESVFVELGASVHRYTAPVMRTVVVGEPRQEILDLEALGRLAMETQLQSMVPGACCADVAGSVAAIVAAAEPEVLFHGFLGYPVGISFPPSWLEDISFQIHETNSQLIDERMVFHIPLSLRYAGRAGVGMSYTVVIERDGAVILNGTDNAVLRGDSIVHHQ